MEAKRIELRGNTKFGTGLDDPTYIPCRAEEMGLGGTAITDVGVVAGYLHARQGEAKLKNPDFKVVYGIQIKMP